MHAIQLHAFGPPENLVLDELPDLTPGPGQVRIAVAASGVHLLDTTIRRGEPGPLPPPELPTVPGREVAGVVDDVGLDVDPGWLGTRVVGSGKRRGPAQDTAPTGRKLPFPIPASRVPLASLPAHHLERRVNLVQVLGVVLLAGERAVVGRLEGGEHSA